MPKEICTQWPVHQDLEHSGPWPMREEICTHWPVHQDLEDRGPCTKTQITVAHAQRDMHTLARAARPRTQCTVHDHLEGSGQGIKT